MKIYVTYSQFERQRIFKINIELDFHLLKSDPLNFILATLLWGSVSKVKCIKPAQKKLFLLDANLRKMLSRSDSALPVDLFFSSRDNDIGCPGS